jgi:hypothetical protein
MRAVLYTSQNSFWKKSKNYFARVKSSAPFVRGKSSAPFVRGKSSAFSSPGKVLGVFQSGDNSNQDLVFWKAKNQIGFSIVDVLNCRCQRKRYLKLMRILNNRDGQEVRNLASTKII